MIVPEYTPGDWYAVVGGGVVVVLDPTTPAQVVQDVWRAAPERGGLTAQLEVLLGQGISGLRAFAAVDLTGGRAHVALRGDVEVTLTVGDEAQVLAARDVVTWSEHVAARPEVVTVRAGAARSSSVPAGEALPVVAGVVRAGGVQVRLSAPTGTAPGPTTGTTSDAIDPAPARPDLTVLPAPRPAASRAVEPQPESLDAAVRTAPAPTPTPTPTPAPTPTPVSALPVDVLPAEPSALGADPFERVVTATTPEHAAADTAPDGFARVSTGVHGHAPETPQEVGAPAVPAPGPVVEDHDGLTIVTGDLAAIRQHLPSWATAHGPGAAPWTGALPAAQPRDPAVATAGGLLVPTHLAGGTGTALADSGPTRPSSPCIVLSTGQTVPLDRVVLIGRAPQATRVSSRDVPRLVTVPSPEQDISRTHAEVRVEGRLTLVTDLDSTNGVTVIAGDGSVRTLPAGVPSPVIPGDVVDLGDGVTFVVEPGA